MNKSVRTENPDFNNLQTGISEIIRADEVRHHRKRRALVTNGRTFIALDMARFLKRSGFEVFSADTSLVHLCRFSNAVTKNFRVPSPVKDEKSFVDSIIEIVNTYDIDLLIPVYEEIFYISRWIDCFPEKCSVFSPPCDQLERLHNKRTFNETIARYGFDTPLSKHIQVKEEINSIDLSFPFIMKAVYSRASLGVHLVKSLQEAEKLEISPENSWIAQQYLVGDKYCTYSICRNGEIMAHATYPVEFSIDGNSCLTFRSVNHEKIFSWIKKFVSIERFTGQIAFDFIECCDKLYAIECNPRATHGFHLLSERDDLIEVFFNENHKTAFPVTDCSRKLGPGMVLYGWRNNYGIKKFIQTFIKTPDIVLDKNDIKPFIFEPLMFMIYSLKCLILKIPLNSMFTYDVEWNGEGKKTCKIQ